MFPEQISTDNSLTIKEPIRIELSVQRDTMVFSGIFLAAILVTVIKLYK